MKQYNNKFIIVNPYAITFKEPVKKLLDIYDNLTQEEIDINYNKKLGDYQSKLAEFTEIQNCYVSKCISQAEALKGFEEYKKGLTKSVIKSGWSYYRTPKSGDSICILDRLDLTLEVIKKKYSMVFYNMEDLSTFTFLNNLGKEKHVLVLNLKPGEVPVVKKALGSKLFNLKMEEIENKNIIKRIYTAALISKADIPYLNTNQITLLKEFAPQLMEDFCVLRKSFSRYNHDNETINAIVEMGKALNLTSDLDVVLDRVLPVIPGLLALRHINDKNSEVPKEYFKMFVKLKKIEHLYPQVKEEEFSFCTEIGEDILTLS